MLQAAEKRGQNVPAWRRRWANVYTPVHLFMYETADVAKWKRDEGVKWQSLSTPAILPVSTRENMASIEADLEASNEQGVDKYKKYTHTVVNPPASSGAHSSTHELLIELVCQRLLHDFQIVKSDAKSAKPAPTSSFSREWGGSGGGGGGGSSTPRQSGGGGGWLKATSSFKIEAQLNGTQQNEFLLSKGAYFHRLVASQDGSHSVSITRYSHRQSSPQLDIQGCF